MDQYLFPPACDGRISFDGQIRSPVGHEVITDVHPWMLPHGFRRLTWVRLVMMKMYLAMMLVGCSSITAHGSDVEAP